VTAQQVAPRGDDGQGRVLVDERGAPLGEPGVGGAVGGGGERRDGDDGGGGWRERGGGDAARGERPFIGLDGRLRDLIGATRGGAPIRAPAERALDEDHAWRGGGDEGGRD